MNKKIPAHIAIIMDGNGRWASLNDKKRIFGHENGVKAVKKITEYCVKLGVEYLTLYTFSNENWNRPKIEVVAFFNGYLLIGSMKRDGQILIKSKATLNVKRVV